MSSLPFQNSRTAFVVIAWNSGAYIRKCVESVLSLECKALDLFVVDNGSTDETPAILKEIAKEDDRLHVITEPKNLGTTVSRNEALKQVSPDADYVCILDSDTVVNQAAFERLTDVLADETIGVVGPTMTNSVGVEQLSGRVFPTLGLKLKKAVPIGRISERAHETEQQKTPIENGLQNVDYLLSACWFMRKSTLDTVGLLDEKIFYAPEDVDWCLRCHKAGLRVVRCHNAHIIHECQRLSHKKLFSKLNFEHMKGLAHYFKKHGYLLKSPSISDYARISNGISEELMHRKSSNIVIAVATHKPYEIPKDDCYLPMHVGADLHPDVCVDMQQDNVGNNISALNAFYSELTGLYWMWKNCDAEYKGLVHYRRHFRSPKFQGKASGLEGVAVSSDYLHLFKNGAQAILPKKRNYYIETIEQHYRHTLPEEQLDTAKKVVNEVSPEYLPAFESVMAGKKAHMFNMFVMQRGCFDAYCEWLFNVLFQLEKELDPTKYDAFHARYLGRISERLLDAWVIKNNIKYAELKTLSPERVNWAKKGTSFLTAKFFKKKYEKSF